MTGFEVMTVDDFEDLESLETGMFDDPVIVKNSEQLAAVFEGKRQADWLVVAAWDYDSVLERVTSEAVQNHLNSRGFEDEAARSYWHGLRLYTLVPNRAEVLDEVDILRANQEYGNEPCEACFRAAIAPYVQKRWADMPLPRRAQLNELEDAPAAYLVEEEVPECLFSVVLDDLQHDAW